MPATDISSAPAGSAPADSRTPDFALIALLMAVHLALFAQAVMHTDLARDLSVAALALGEGAWPLLGPVMAGRLHLGPAWYYLLALLLAPGAGVLGVQVGLGLLSAAQYPLAWLCGLRLHSATLGRWWATLLLLPSWSSFELVYPQHTSLTAPLLLGFGACALGYWRSQRPAQLIGAALLAALAVHAHPSAAGALAPAGLLVAWAVQRGHLRLPLALGCAFAAALPFLPMLLMLGSGSYDPLAAVAGHYGSIEGQVSLAAAPTLLWQASAGGGAYLLGDLIELGGAAATGWQLLYAVLALLALHGLWRQRSRGGWVAASRVLGLATLALLLTALLLRAFHPYYMATALRVALLGLLALGLCGALGHRGRARSIALAVVVATGVAGSLLLAAGLQRMHAGEGLRFALLPLFDIKQAAQPATHLPLPPLRHIDAQARAVCSLPSASLHGPWASVERNHYGIGLRLHCPDTALRGDDAAASGLHVVAIGGAHAGLLESTPLGQSAGLGLFAARRVLHASSLPLLPPAPLPYPAVEPARDGGSRAGWQFDPASATRLLATQTGFILDPAPTFQLRCGGQPRAPLAADALSRLWSLEGCSKAELDVEGADSRRLELLLL